jgi:hypothetical protein
MRPLGVAISTTGDEHRMPLLVQSVIHWDEALPAGASLYVTVDGDEEAAEYVAATVSAWTGAVFRVGQPAEDWDHPLGMRDGRLGVAANKNTGLELLIENADCERLFLSDDDAWPLTRNALDLHINLGLPHSMVCWGRHRRSSPRGGYAAWTWPRGSVLYVEREVVEEVGGMVEQFGPGGHEHVEWSRRIHRAGLTPVDFPSPMHYVGHTFMGAADFWHCEDMARPGESVRRLMARRRALTSVRRHDGDDQFISEIMAGREGNTDFVPFRSAENRRQSATMTPHVSA